MKERLRAIAAWLKVQLMYGITLLWEFVTLRMVATAIVGLVALFLLIFFATSVHGAARPSIGAVVDSVRKVTDENGQGFCSSVVVGKGYALTARHCLFKGMLVDGHPVSYVISPAPEPEDIAVLNVPGLDCPCAPLGHKPEVGSFGFAVGYPVSLGGERRPTDVVRVTHVENFTVLAPWLAGHPQANIVMIFTPPVLDYGDSGGGLFVYQDREWRLVGINVVGVPDAPPPFTTKEIASGYMPLEVAERFMPTL